MAGEKKPQLTISGAVRLSSFVHAHSNVMSEATTTSECCLFQLDVGSLDCLLSTIYLTCEQYETRPQHLKVPPKVHRDWRRSFMLGPLIAPEQARRIPRICVLTMTSATRHHLHHWPTLAQTLLVQPPQRVYEALMS